MSGLQVSTAALQSLTAEQAMHYRALPVSLDDGELEVLIAEGTDPEPVRQAIGLLTGFTIAVGYLPARELDGELVGAYRQGGGGKSSPRRAAGPSEDLLATIFAEAVGLSASDIHLEPAEDISRVRLRVDGALLERFVVEPDQYPRLVNQVKVRANLDISQRRLPQDGRLALEDHGLDVRVAIAPTLHGEKVVMRLLGASARHLSLDDAGMDPEQLACFRAGVARETGIVMISGPTGSGKTTTLWGSLAELNAAERNIMTVEDPIEYTLGGINQVQANERVGLTFAVALRSFLRLDPDIIMVGEIRDLETAQIAVRASTTGHLVLSTIHTNSAWGIVARLRDMGLPGYLLADTLNTLVAQRLLRRLCEVCKRPAAQGEQGFEAPGCPACHYTGYKGRIALYEVIPVTATLREAIRVNGPAPGELSRYPSLASRAKYAVAKGLTSVREARALLAADL